LLGAYHAGRARVLNSSRDESACQRFLREKRPGVPLSNMDSHFIDQSRQSLDIRNIETAPRAEAAIWEPITSEIQATCTLAWRVAVSRRPPAPVVVADRLL